MLIKIKDYRIVASKVTAFYWEKYKDYDQKNRERLTVIYGASGDYQNEVDIEGPRSLLEDFEKQYNEIMK